MTARAVDESVSSQHARPEKPERVKASHPVFARLWRYRALYAMLFPVLVWLVVYKYLPMYGITVAFKDYRIGSGILASPWADPWYKYFQQFFSSPYFGQLLSNTLIISIYKIIWGTVPSLVLALLLNECRTRWLRRWAQTLSYMPHFLSWVIIYGIAIAFLSQSGIVNTWMNDTIGDTIPFLSSTSWFRTVLIGAFTWHGIGWGAIIYLAGMAAVDPELYEAARVDGAGRLRQMWSITLPGIRPIIILLFILHLGNIMEAGFEQVYIFYNVPVYPVADIIDTWVFRTGLQSLNFSLAAAVGIFKSVIGLVLVLGANRLAKRWDGQIW